jgi:hypothetical protein
MSFRKEILWERRPTGLLCPRVSGSMPRHGQAGVGHPSRRVREDTALAVSRVERLQQARRAKEGLIPRNFYAPQGVQAGCEIAIGERSSAKEGGHSHARLRGCG